jgi:VacB/RNase II family 3'-5' exoribonuclease
MLTNGFDLAGAAYREMMHDGFEPDFPVEAESELAALERKPAPAIAAGAQDLRGLYWSSIDNDTSKDLDQIEYAERVPGGIRVLVGIADVDSDVPKGTALDKHAASNTTSVYTAVRVFPMLPEELSTGLTSLNENQDRLAIVMEFVVASDGSMGASKVYQALVRNKAQLAYDETGAWLENRAPAGAKVAASAELQAQLRLQDEAAKALKDQRHRLGALNFDRTEAVATVTDGAVQGIRKAQKTRANELIEDFMIAANEVMAQTLKASGYSSIRRVVRSPERWPRIVELAAKYGEHLPEQPDSAALNAFLMKRKAADPVHYDDISLGVLKLMGPGEYVMSKAGEDAPGHFGLAAPDYTHATAPNRRFADLVMQRLIKAVFRKQPAPYSDADLDAIAKNCTLKEDAARKVERAMEKRVAAVAMRSHVGQIFAAVVTGVTPRGTFVRVPNPPVDGMLLHGHEGVDVGDQIKVKLIAADPQRGFIDFDRE